jgi:hypothetical protein
MKKFAKLILAVVAVAAPAALAFAEEAPEVVAQGPALLPIPEAQPAQPGTPVPAVSKPVPGSQPVLAQGSIITLYPNVRYKDERRMAPGAVPQIVFVKDPCLSGPRNRGCEPRCVAVQICVPPCSTCPPRVVCRRGGEYVKYDFGKYQVEIRSRRGCVTVDYDA